MAASAHSPAPQWLDAERARFRLYHAARWACVTLYVGSLAAWLALALLHGLNGWRWAALGAAFALSLAGIEVTHRAWRRRSARLAEAAAHAGCAAVAPLAEALDIDDFPHGADWRAGIAAALCRALDEVAPGGQPVPSGAWRRLSCVLALPYADELEALQVAAMQAACRCDARGVLQAVRALAAAPPCGPAQERVRAQAERCAVLLGERADRERAARGLLRPAPAAPAEALLRPASAVVPPPGALVRPAGEQCGTQHRGPAHAREPS